MAFFIGIDAGGSKTRCALGDEERVLATALTSSCKIQRVGEDEARRALHNVIQEVCKIAGVPARGIEHACIGISGASDSGVVERVRSILGEVISAPADVVGDMIIALEAGLGSGPGCILVAGTGSIAVGRDEHGHLARVGGWGPTVSDEGSGYWIGRAAVGAVLRAHDSGKSTALASAITQAWGLSTYEDFVLAASAAPPPDFAQLFPIVLEEAAQGDPMAGEILKRAGIELAELALIVIRRLWPGQHQVRVVVSGGVFENSQVTREVFANTLRNAFPQIAVSLGNMEPVMGALSLARRQHSAISSQHSAPKQG